MVVSSTVRRRARIRSWPVLYTASRRFVEPIGCRWSPQAQIEATRSEPEQLLHGRAMPGMLPHVCLPSSCPPIVGSLILDSAGPRSSATPPPSCSVHRAPRFCPSRPAVRRVSLRDAPSVRRPNKCYSSAFWRREIQHRNKSYFPSHYSLGFKCIELVMFINCSDVNEVLFYPVS